MRSISNLVKSSQHYWRENRSRLLVQGVVYDDVFDQANYNLTDLFLALKPTLEHYADISTRNSTLPRSQKFKFTIEKFFINQLCSLISHGVHLVLSLTACSTAEYLESEAYRYHLPHVAIPRPTCEEKQITKVTETTTIWIQTNPFRMAKALLEISEMERASHALLLADGLTAIIPGIYDLTLRRKIENKRFYTDFSTQLFSSNKCINSFSSFSGITLDQFIETLGENRSKITITKSYLTHIFFIHTKPYHLNYLRKVFEKSNITKNYYWIFDEIPDVPISDLLNFIASSNAEKMKVGFFRQFPVLNFDDLSKHELPKSTQLLIKSALLGETHSLPERVTISAYMIMMGSQIATYIKSFNSTYLDRSGISCHQINPIVDDFGGRLFYNFLRHRSGTNFWKSLWFYSLETFDDAMKNFISTAHYTPDDNMKLTSKGMIIKQRSLESGLFSTVFQSFNHKTLRISTILDPPFVVTGQVIGNGEIINATGFAIDVLNELAIHFNFSYRLFVPQNGTYGSLDEKGEWDGMMGELVNGRVDMIAAGLTINPRRSNYVEFIGPIVEDTVGILVKPSTANDLFFQMFHLFQINVWIAITSSVVVLGTTVWLFNKYSPLSGWNLQLPEANSNEVSLPYNLWISLRCMLLQGQEGRLFCFSSRTLSLMYWFMILVVHAIWQADLTAFLTKNNLKLPISSLKDLAYNDKIIVLTMKGTSTYNMFKVSVNNTFYESIYRKLVANPVSVYSTGEAVKLVVKSDNYVYITERLFLLSVLQSEECSNLEVIEEPGIVVALGFAVHLGKEYAKPMSSYMLTLRERGIINKFMVKWNMTSDVDPMRVQYQALTIWNVAGAFIVTSIFTGISLFILLVEWVWYRWRSRKNMDTNSNKNNNNGK
uniref:Glutamate receptor n=1 Tax=Schistosoma mansoni TaxID=6183 RepID=A0A5K4F5F2_SCHMA